MSAAVLNPSQKEAVETLKGPLLVLAGAGSGKTRILTFRIVHLIESGAAFPGEIFSVTFTNKAAKEMKERVSHLLQGKGIPIDDVWISTFHSSGARILRQYGDRIGLERGFSIFDDSDSFALIKDCMETLEISDKVVAPKAVHWRIQQLKNEGIDPMDFKASSHDFFEKKIEPLVHAYELGLRRNNAVDFGDLLLKTYLLFERDPALLDAFQERYRFFLVDEYQDTNGVQYKLLRLLAQKYRNLCVVGDEDQSIYRWRGADIRNILDFERDYPEARVVKLEENYRSSGHIIRASNKVIANNTQRKEKTLFTSNPDGEQVEVHHMENDLEEARFVVGSIKKLIDEGESPAEISIFYRTHAQSRLFEDVLRMERLPYRIYGGLKFYDRAEVKDALAYMKALANPRDDVSLSRIINVPARGIGKTSVEAAKNYANQERIGLMQAMERMAGNEGEIGSAARKKFGVFVELIERLKTKVADLTPREFYSLVLDETGYTRALENENTIEAAARLENLQELANALGDYEVRALERGADATISGFLEEVALYTDMDRAEENVESVTMMTIHSAKGLEFRNVFLVGLEEELFPSIKGDVFSDKNDDDVEEERRLCYVGMTRARERLWLSSAHVRRVYGQQKVRRPSRFLAELPDGEVLVKDHAPVVRSYNFGSGSGSSWGSSGGGAGGWGNAPKAQSGAWDDYYDAPTSSTASKALDAALGFEGEDRPDDSYRVGVTVKHPDYGVGRIIKREGNRDGLKLSIQFQKAGTKKFLAKYAPLEVVG
jgi:DNA helicase-2/ATP-dependent DNA helicase PcrA